MTNPLGIDLDTLPAPDFGPTGETVFTRSYARPLPDGSLESYAETVLRVVIGNLSLVHGDPETWTEEVRREARALFFGIYRFEIIPAGRHLWASGVKGRQYLFNCHVSGWGEKFSDHFAFTFMRLMEGGGVGANYSSNYVQQYGAPKRRLKVHVVADRDHADIEELRRLHSEEFSAEWPGAFEIADSREGWADALVDLIDTYFADEVKHEDRVYDVTLVRPKGSRLKTFGGSASGPVPLANMLTLVADVLNRAFERGYITPLDAMDLDHAIGECVVAGGVRRSARMSIVRWDDPAIFDFIDAKSDPSKHWTTNISVEVDDRFFAYLSENYQDTSGHGQTAHEVHQAVVAGMLANGEPGYWNSSLSNEGEVGYVEATNPCGEIALQAWENCNLGHVNLEAFVANDGSGFDFEGMQEAHRLMARFLIRATFGDVTSDRQAAILAENRRIGVGHLGVQGFLVRQGIRFSEAPYDMAFANLLAWMRNEVREEARAYAFALRVPEPVKVTTVAPTGSIAKMPGATEGIHPVYARHFIRRVRFSMIRPEEYAQALALAAQGYDIEDDTYAENTVVVSIPTKERLVQIVEDLGYEPEVVEDASEISLRDMLAMQRVYQAHYADNAVSFTINVPEGSLSPDEVGPVLAEFLPALKGTTMMPDGTRPQAPYERISADEYERLTQVSGDVIDDSYDEECASGACPIR